MILEIALGIVLAVVIIALLPILLPLAAIFGAIALVILIIIGLFQSGTIQIIAFILDIYFGLMFCLKLLFNPAATLKETKVKLMKFWNEINKPIKSEK